MLHHLKDKLTIFTGKLLLNIDEEEELAIGKRIISIIAGAYIFQRGVRSVFKSPIIALQEVILGSFLLYNGGTGLNILTYGKPKEHDEVRKNQIQGNDPDLVPEFI